MKINELKTLFIIGYLIMVVSLLSPLVLTGRINSEKFFSLAILGQDKKVDQYFPRNIPVIEEDQKINWTIYLLNSYDEIVYFSIRVKLANDTVPDPNSVSCNPSSSPVIYEFNRFLEKDSEIYIPFEWTLLNYNVMNNKIELTNIMINDIVLNNTSISGIKFRFIFELWVFNENYDRFEFAWINEDLVKNCAWNQIWFIISQEET